MDKKNNMNDAKVLRKYTDIVKDFAFIITIIVGLVAGWYQLKSDVSSTKSSIEHLQKENDQLVSAVTDISKRTSDNGTDIKVIETQLKLLGGSQ